MKNISKIKKSIIVIFLLITFNLSAKIVYISWMEQQGFYPVSNQLVSIDLDTGNIIKQVLYQDSHFSSIFINKSSTDLYAFDTNHNRIIKVASSSLTIEQEWDVLPSNLTDFVLNEKNNHIYLANTSIAGTGHDDLYQIDLSNNEVSIVDSPVNGLDIQAIFMSEDKSVLYIQTYNFLNSEFRYHSFNALDMQLIASSSAARLFKTVFTNDGKYYYGINTQNNTLNGYDLVNGTLLWSTPISISFPIRFLFEVDESSLAFIDSQNNYRIDKLNGVITINNDFSMTEQTSLIDINNPSILCITGFCILGSKLIINKYLPTTNSFENIFESEFYAGAQDYVFGKNLSATPIPALNWIGWPVLCFSLLILSYIKRSNISFTRRR